MTMVMHNDKKVHNIVEIVLMMTIRISYTSLNEFFLVNLEVHYIWYQNYRLQHLGLRTTPDFFFLMLNEKYNKKLFSLLQIEVVSKYFCNHVRIMENKEDLRY
jgi:hypothetical protein